MAADAEIWMTLDSLAASYERTHGVRPNRLIIGREVAKTLEPDHGDHPLHLSWHSYGGGVWFPDQPVRTFELFWRRWAREWACKRQSGHWWHPVHGTMIEWFCCRCGKTCDGMPKDGT